MMFLLGKSGGSMGVAGIINVLTVNLYMDDLSRV